jgi:acyl-CoA thioesterase FadM
MARLHLEFPEECYCYRTQMEVRVTDINAAGHLGNDSMISMISEARARFLDEYGTDAPNEDGISTIVTDLATTYKAEAHARDLLLFEVGVADFNKYGGDVVFRISRPRDGVLVAMAKSGFIFFDYRRSRVAPMPAAFAARFPNVTRVG